METVIVPAEIVEQRSVVVQEATAMVVFDKEGAEEAATVGRSIKALQAEIKSTFRPIIDAAHHAHKEALAQEKKYLSPLVEAEGILKSKILEWNRKEQAKEAEARRQREETERLKMEAEALRLAAEGKDEEALVVLQEAEEYVEEADKVKIDGAQVRRNLDVRVDIEQLVAAVAAGKAPLEFLAPNAVAIRGAMRSLDEKAFEAKFGNCGLQLYDKGSVAF